MFSLCIALFVGAYSGLLPPAAEPTRLWEDRPGRSRRRRNVRLCHIRRAIVVRLRTQYVIRRYVRWLLRWALFLLAIQWMSADGPALGLAAAGALAAPSRLDVVREKSKTVVTIQGPITFEVANGDRDLRKVMAIALSQVTVPVAPGKGHHLSQQEIAMATATSRPSVSQWLGRYRKDGLAGLLRRVRRAVPWPQEVIDQVIRWQAEDPAATPKSLAEKLNAAGFVSTAVEAEDIAQVFTRVDFNSMRPVLAQAFGQRGTSEIADYLIQRLFELNDKLVACAGALTDGVRVEIEELRKQYTPAQENGKPKRTYQWDRDTGCPAAAVRRTFKQRALQALLAGRETAEIACPDCSSTRVRIKEMRTCKVSDIDGQEKDSLSVRFYCGNAACPRKTFTISATERELGAHVTKAVKAKALAQLFHLRASLRHCADELPIDVDHTTVLRWVQRLAAELVPWYELFGSRTSGRIVVDEKWVKLHQRWFYVFFAVDEVSRDLLHIDVFPTANERSAETFLRQLKGLGFEPEVIATDQMGGYARAVRQVFPAARHRECLLHAERNARRAIFRAVGGREDPRYELLVEPLHRVFASKTLKELEQAWQSFLAAAAVEPGMQVVAERIRANCAAIVAHGVRHPADPRTTNAVERVIQEFVRKYDQMQAFNSFPSLRAWCMLFQVYYRLRPFKRGHFAGKSPAEVMGYPVENLEWTDYVLGLVPRAGEKTNVAA